MLEFSEAVKEHAERSVRDVASSPPLRAVNRAEVWLVENQRSRGRARGHEFECDEPSERGGTDVAPTPLEYMLASLGFCQEVMIARNAALRDLRLEDVHIGVRGYFDRRGGRVEGIENRGFEEIRLDIKVRSPENAKTITDLMRTVDRECYALNTLRRAATVRATLELNGEKIDEVEYGPTDAS